MDGLEMLWRLREVGNDSLVIVISGHGNIEIAVKATKLAAYDFLEKPLSLDNTLLTVRNAIRRRRLERANKHLQVQLENEYVLVGSSIPMRAVRKQIAAIAKSDSRVLIWGESGSGKELVARAMNMLYLKL